MIDLTERATATTSLLTRARRNVYVRAVGVYFGVQLLGVLVLALFATWHGLDLLDRMTAWDGKWYLDIAANGYDGVSGHTPSFEHAAMAFFPLYPGLISLFTLLPGASTGGAALTISVLAGATAACGLVRITRTIDDRPVVGLLLVALWAGAPMAIVLAMAYTEALFCALVVWALVGVLERNWLLAATCCLFAGTVRPVAGALIVTVAVAALYTAWRESGRQRWKALGCLVACPLGLVGYLGWVAVRTGSVTGWFELEQRGWSMGFDFGAETAEWLFRTLLGGSSVMITGAAVLLIVAVVLLLVGFARRIPWQLTLYAAGVLAMVAGTGGLPMTKPRLLLVAMFVLLLPVAVGLANRERAARVGGAAALVAMGVWFSAHALTVWQYTI